MQVGDFVMDTHGLGEREVQVELEKRGLKVKDHISIRVDFLQNAPFSYLIEQLVALKTDQHNSYFNKYLVVVSEERDGLVLMSSYDGYRLDIWKVGS